MLVESVVIRYSNGIGLVSQICIGLIMILGLD